MLPIPKKLAFETNEEPKSHTQNPFVVGGSVLAMKYKDGVLVATDRQLNYGSLAKYKDSQRMQKVTNNTLIGCGGEYSDFQYICRKMKEKHVEDWIHGDGNEYTAKEYFNLLTRMNYKARMNMDPLWNSTIVAGFHEGQGFLGTTDLYGTHYEGDFLVTGLANYFAKPLIEGKWHKDISLEEAVSLMEEGLRVLHYRVTNAGKRVQFGKVTADGVEIGDPYDLQLNFGYELFRNPVRRN